MTLAGPRFALLDPTLLDEQEQRDPCSVLVALGGGPRAELAIDIAEAIVDNVPTATVRIAGGFVSTAAPARQRITWVGPSRSLRQLMARASVAVVGGGVSLYEACAHGTPAVGVPVVPAQRPTVAAFVAHGAAKGTPSGPLRARDVAEECVSLLSDAAMRRHLSRMGRRLIDGRGAFRAAAAVRRMVADGRSR
jgi:spore coat polysaccharide biosynthesis predicted glycosyltransferase SpsG